MNQKYFQKQLEEILNTNPRFCTFYLLILPFMQTEQ